MIDERIRAAAHVLREDITGPVPDLQPQNHNAAAFLAVGGLLVAVSVTGVIIANSDSDRTARTVTPTDSSQSSTIPATTLEPTRAPTATTEPEPAVVDPSTSGTGFTVPARPTRVIVANGSSTNGAASSLTTALANAGFTAGPATNSTAVLEVSIVYFAPGFDDIANTLATDLGGADIAPLPTGVNLVEGDLPDVDLLVIVGLDHGSAFGTTSFGPPVPTEELAQITAQANAALIDLTSFSATATIRRSGSANAGGESSEIVTTNQVTLFGDGLMWVETERGGWSSYDPASGTTRLAYSDEAGVLRYQQIDGWTENVTGLGVLLGHDPGTMIPELELGEHPTVAETTFDGRPAWSLSSGAPAADGRSALVVIDKQTGLTVHVSTTLPAGNGVETVESSLTGLTANVAVPEAFPGSFPDGAVVDRSGATLERLSIDDLASHFGTGFVAPADLDSAALLGLVDTPVQMGAYDERQLTATIVLHQGFLQTRIEMVKHVFVSGAPQPHEAVVDGAICPSDDGVTCSTMGGEAPTGSLVQTGAFAGHLIDPNASYAFFQTGPTIYMISAPDAAVLTNLVSSLVTYS